MSVEQDDRLVKVTVDNATMTHSITGSNKVFTFDPISNIGGGDGLNGYPGKFLSYHLYFFFNSLCATLNSQKMPYPTTKLHCETVTHFWFDKFERQRTNLIGIFGTLFVSSYPYWLLCLQLHNIKKATKHSCECEVTIHQFYPFTHSLHRSPSPHKLCRLPQGGLHQPFRRHQRSADAVVDQGVVRRGRAGLRMSGHRCGPHHLPNTRVLHPPGELARGRLEP